MTPNTAPPASAISDEQIMEVAEDWGLHHAPDTAKHYARAVLALRPATSGAVPADPLLWLDRGHVREVLNGNRMPIYASDENDGTLMPVYAAPAGAAGQDAGAVVVQPVAGRYRSPLEIMSLVDDFAEARHKHGAPEYNSISNLQRLKVVKALAALAAQGDGGTTA